MRALVVLLSIAGCMESEPLTLPPATELSPRVIFVGVAGDAIYWTEPGEPRGEADVVRLRRYRAGTTETVDELVASFLTDLTGPFLVVDEATLVWGYAGGFMSCGHGRLVRADRAGTDLALWSALGGNPCRAAPLDLRGGRLLFAAPNGELTGMALQVLDLGTGAVEPRAELPGWTLRSPAVTSGNQLVAMLGSLQVRDDGQLVGIDRDAASTTAWIGGSIRRPGGFAVDGDTVTWIDNGVYDDGARVVQQPRTQSYPPGAVVATLDRNAVSLTSTDGALWMIEGELGAPSESLIELRDGTPVAYALDLPAERIVGAGAALVVVGAPDDLHRPLRLQPLR